MIEDIVRQLAHERPEHVAVVDGQRSYTYLQLNMSKENLARHLATTLGIREGEKIALFLPNSAEFVFSFFANVQIGAISIPLNTHLKEIELRYFLDKYGISAVITTSDLAFRWGCIRSQIEKERLVVIDRLEGCGRDKGDFLKTEGERDQFKRADPDSEVLWLTTSGSTGRPKVVSRSQANLINNAGHVAGALRVTDQDRFLSVVPFYHANGFANCMFLPITRGATAVVMRQFSARKMIHLIRQEKVTIVFGSPFVFSVLSEAVDEGCHLPSVRFCLSTGAPMPEGLQNTFMKKFRMKIRQLYGSSEAGTISIQLEDLGEDVHFLGKPLKNVEVKIVSETGEELPSTESGEIMVRSPALTKGYVQESELNEEAFHNGYFRTGDLGMLAGDGRLYISGRKKRVINAAGVKVDPVEIENVLVSFHKVREAFVFGVENRRGMEIIKAIVIAQPDCGVSEVISYCKDKLADYKIPRIVEFKEEIRRDIMGKVFPVNEEA
ncbi:MAG: acyl--CoA ligase [Deltaproteobacteria bacterium]|nr:acyl--CoA ligase [Deltaproteobacteria bacterium]